MGEARRGHRLCRESPLIGAQKENALAEPGDSYTIPRIACTASALPALKAPT
ncbi:MAG: hypothetical protein V4623_10560 [Pseudomonadota bacterium]